MKIDEMTKTIPIDDDIWVLRSPAHHHHHHRRIKQ
ncbi:unnamed protein product, partial [Rotaria socialis]